MTRIVFAMAVATLLMFAVSGTSQAAPIAPPTGVISSEMSSDNGVTQVRWWPTSLGHKAGFAGISRPPTEGGVGLTQGIYVVPWHSRIYALTMTAYGRPVPTRMSQFPSIYRQILATWRFL